MSEKSSLLSEDKFIEKRRNERFAYLLGIFAQFVWALNGLQLKSYQPSYPDCYTNNATVFWRSVPVMIIGYLICKYRQIRITPHSEVKHIVWFYFRNLGNYFGVSLNLKVLSYFRLSTARVFLGCQPLVIIFLSIIVLSETFYWRYLLGILICLSGSAIILLNDKKPQSRHTILNNNVYEGLVFAILFLIVGSFNSVGQKMLCKEGMQADVQNFYLGFYNALVALIMCIYEGRISITHPGYVLSCMSNGLLFYLASYTTSVCYKYIAMSKYQPVTYLVVVFTFFLSVLVLGEPLFLTDLLGATLIIGFQFYNLTFPPKRNVNANNINDNNKDNFIQKMNNDDDIIINRISNSAINQN